MEYVINDQHFRNLYTKILLLESDMLENKESLKTCKELKELIKKIKPEFEVEATIKGQGIFSPELYGLQFSKVKVSSNRDALATFGGIVGIVANTFTIIDLSVKFANFMTDTKCDVIIGQQTIRPIQDMAVLQQKIREAVSAKVNQCPKS